MSWLKNLSPGNWITIVVVVAAFIGNYYVLGKDVSDNTIIREKHDSQIREIELKILKQHYDLLIIINNNAKSIESLTGTVLEHTGPGKGIHYDLTDRVNKLEKRE